MKKAYTIIIALLCLVIGGTAGYLLKPTKNKEQEKIINQARNKIIDINKLITQKQIYWTMLKYSQDESQKDELIDMSMDIADRKIPWEILKLNEILKLDVIQYDASGHVMTNEKGDTAKTWPTELKIKQ